MKRLVVLLSAAAILAAVSLVLERSYVTSGTSACTAMADPTLARCFKEVLVRTVLHVLGGAFIVLLLHWSRTILRMRVQVVLALIVIVYFFIQEFYLHPLRYAQPFFKSVIDFLAWTIPVGAYNLIQSVHGIHSEHRGRNR